MGGTLLLADDSITIQKVVELTFAETDHAVVAVGNGRDLLQRLAQVNPDVVLCDVVMPDMNGYDVCQTLKSDPATLHIPVILLTGTFEPFDRDRALAAGCDAIVTKPFEARELIATVEDLLQRSMSAKGAAEDEGQPMAELGVPEGVPSLDFTTTGFEKMVPPPPKPQLPPEEGIELTSSALGRSFSAPPPPAPPELAEAPLEAVGERLATVPETVGETQPAVATEAFEDAFEAAPLEEETFPSARVDAPSLPDRGETGPMRIAEAPPAAADARVEDSSSTMKLDLEAIKRETPGTFQPPEPFAPAMTVQAAAAPPVVQAASEPAAYR
ncbi:MAG: response regulator, partial [Acidobacteriota bacterium]